MSRESGELLPITPYKTLAPGDRTVPWLSHCRDSWRFKPLKYLCALNRSVLSEATDSDYQFMYIDISSVNSEGWWTASELIRFEDAPSRARRVVQNGDVLISTVRTYLRAITYLPRIEQPIICSTGFAVLTAESEVYPGFLAYWVRSSFFVDEIMARSLGVSYPAINASDIGNLPLPYIPFDEQRSIATFLDRETARINTLIEKKQRQIELLQEKRAALISHAVTKGLNPKAKKKDSGIEWLGEIPEHWEVKKVKRLGVIRYGLGEPPEYVDDGLSFIRATDIQRGKIDLEKVRKVRREDIPWSRRPLLSLHEILVVRSGAYTGDSAIVNESIVGCVAGYDMILTVLTAHPPFIAWVFLSKYMLQGQIYLERLRAAQPHLNAEELGGFIVLIPPLVEQRAIAIFLDRETTRIDALINKVENSIAMLHEYRIAIISAAVTGKIDVWGTNR